jgi:hypothetical protein
MSSVKIFLDVIWHLLDIDSTWCQVKCIVNKNFKESSVNQVRANVKSEIGCQDNYAVDQGWDHREDTLNFEPGMCPADTKKIQKPEIGNFYNIKIFMYKYAYVVYYEYVIVWV